MAADWLRWARPASPPSAKASTIPSSPPPLSFSLAPSRRVQICGATALCATAVVKERYHISRGANGQPFRIAWPCTGRKNAPYFACELWICVRVKFESRVYARIGANPHVGAALMIVRGHGRPSERSRGSPGRAWAVKHEASCPPDQPRSLCRAQNFSP